MRRAGAEQQVAAGGQPAQVEGGLGAGRGGVAPHDAAQRVGQRQRGGAGVAPWRAGLG